MLLNEMIRPLELDRLAYRRATDHLTKRMMCNGVTHTHIDDPTHIYGNQ